MKTVIHKQSYVVTIAAALVAAAIAVAAYLVIFYNPFTEISITQAPLVYNREYAAK